MRKNTRPNRIVPSRLVDLVTNPQVVSANPGDPNSGVTVVAKPGTEYNGEVVLIKPDAAFSFEMTAMTSQLMSHAKWMKKQLKDGVTSGTSQYKPALGKKVEEAIVTHHPHAQGFKPCLLRGHSLNMKNEIFGFQHWAVGDTHLFVGPSAYGIGEARLLLGGAIIVAGVLISELPGEDLRQKIQGALTSGGSETFINLVRTPGKGFLCVHDEPHSVLCIPNAYLVATTPVPDPNDPTNGACGVRWGLMPNLPGFLSQAKENLDGMATTYTALAQNADFTSFKDYVTEGLADQPAAPAPAPVPDALPAPEAEAAVSAC
eukprot:7342590-Pyramimonas_sp.AAC.1